MIGHVQINIMGNINEPFLSTNRFEATFASDTPNYALQLSISGKRIKLFLLFYSIVYYFSCMGYVD